MTTHSIKGHHRVALALTVPLIVAIGVDSAYRVATGDPTFITDDTVGPAVLAALVAVLLAAAFLALFRVLREEAPRFAALGRVPRACHKVLLFGTALLGVGTLVSPVLAAMDVDSGPLYDVFGFVATAGLALTVLAGLVLGLTQVRHNTLGWGGRVLALIVPAGLLTAAVAMVDPELASPVLFTACLLGGLAMLGAGPVTREQQVLA